MANLRDYQIALINQARTLLKDHKSVLIQGATGMGKTVLSSFMLKALADQNKNGLFICHRRELVKQTDESFDEFKISHAIISSGYKLEMLNPIQICSIGSLINKLQSLPKPDFIIWDECHHIAAATWKKIFDYFPEAHHIGLTATPQRLDGKPLGEFFEVMIQAPSMRNLINQGYLSDFDIYAPSQPDLSQVKTKNGDYDLESLDKAINKPSITGCAVEHYKKICNGKRAVVFCASINHSQSVVQKFNDSGIRAAHIDGSMTISQRDALIEDFKNGDLLILSNVDIVSEGFDLPAIEAAILLRPTQSLGLYLQQVGRALRISAGKTRAIILDHAGNCLKHKMPDYEHVWNLSNSLSKNKERTLSNNLKTCSQCYKVLNILSETCDCGYASKRRSNLVNIKEGFLEKVSIPLGKKGLSRESADNILNWYNLGYTYKSIATMFKHDPNVVAKVVERNPSLAIPKDTWLELKFERELTEKFVKNNQTSCWEWNGSMRWGSPHIGKANKTVCVKKYLYSKRFGYDKGKFHFRNQCNNKFCVNPDHLIKTTTSEYRSIINKNIDPEKKKMIYQRMLEGLSLNKHKHSKAVVESNAIKTKLISISTTNGQFIGYFSVKEASKFLKISTTTLRTKLSNNNPIGNYLIKSYLPF